MSAIQTIAIAASTSQGERACNSTSATKTPPSTIQPTTIIANGARRDQRRTTHGVATSSQKTVATPQTARMTPRGQP